MDEISDESVQLIVTSPPYGKIKDYGLEDQIGFSESFDTYFSRLKTVWSECHRVLEPQCRLVINVGDQYLRTSDHGRYRILSIASKITENCMDLGFDFLGDIIWQKVSTTNTTGGCSLMGSIYYPRNGLLTYDYEHVLIFKKFEGKGRNMDRKIKELSKITLSEWKKWYIGHWKFPGIIQKEHVAMFPDELPYRIIRMFSFIGDTVLDPFLGSGSTLKVAKALFRKGIGYEINKEFKNIIETKVKLGKIGLFKDYQYLLYKLFKKSKSESFKINFDKQKQKGILVLEDSEHSEILIDYILLEIYNINEEFIIKELKSKFDENSIKYYLNSKEKWDHYKNYVIVMNSELSKRSEFQNVLENFLSSLNNSKSIQFISLEQITSKNYQILELFKEKNEIEFFSSINKGKDILSYLK